MSEKASTKIPPSILLMDLIKRNDANAVKQFLEMPQYRDIIDKMAS